MLPDTSHAAHQSVTESMLTNHWGKILDALKVLKLATYEEIALFCRFPDKNMVSRRLKELEGEQMVYKPGTKKPTTSGRQAYQYALRNENVTLPPPPEKYIKGQESAADIACGIIAKTKMGKLKQAELFMEGLDKEK